ncbi:hypothetical protein AAU61_01175 [Desulfocarbo indianensis]|nr:hypothetical protein AAU61_01175 [Desulfocarbo indianensis]
MVAEIIRREVMVKQVMGGKIVGQLAVDLAARRRIVYKWLAHYRSGGEVALQNCSSRPRRRPGRSPVEKMAIIAALHRSQLSAPL